MQYICIYKDASKTQGFAISEPEFSVTFEKSSVLFFSYFMGQKTSGDPWSVRDSSPTRTSLRETISELVTTHSCTASLSALPSRNNINPNLESYKNALPCALESYKTPSKPIGAWEDSLRGPLPPPMHSYWSPGSHI